MADAYGKHNVHVRMSEDEYAVLAKLADKELRSMSEMVRVLVLKEARQHGIVTK